MSTLGRTPPSSLTLAQALTLVQPKTARHLGAIPLRLEGDTLVVGAARAGDPRVADAVRRLGHRTVKVEAIESARLDHLLRTWYGPTAELFEIAGQAGERPPPPGSRPAVGADTTFAVRYVEALLGAAVAERASDIHLEVHARGARVRFRVDGLLSARPAPAPWLLRRSIQRIRALAKLDLGADLRAQDGAFTATGPHGPVDVRISILPTHDGLSAVLRLLGSAADLPSIPDLGLAGPAAEHLLTAAQAPDGLIVIAGPTGSGKTTTLHALIRTLDFDRLNVVSIEDPVEIRAEGVRQISIRRETGLDFAGSLRVVLRQDPDVILVGETRDRETAALCGQAALAGHLVLTTVHATDALGVLERLRGLGLETGVLRETLRVVASQRLVRTVCAVCGGGGCFPCEGTGLRGRIGVYEILPVTEALRPHVGEVDRLGLLALEAGFQPFAVVTRALCASGRTRPREIERVFGPSVFRAAGVTRGGP